MDCTTVGGFGAACSSVMGYARPASDYANGFALTPSQAQQMLAQQFQNESDLNRLRFELAKTPSPPPQAAKQASPYQPKGASMFSEIAKDVKSFVLEHRSTLYFLAIALIVDHVIFKDAFRTRLQSIVEKIITKVEDKVSA